jgi:Domain of unknown function (DUF1772)
VAAFADVLRSLNLAAAGILAGALLFELLVLVEAFRRIDVDTSARMHRVVLENLPDRFVPAAGAIAGATGVLLAVLPDQGTTTSRILYGAGSLAAVGVGFLTFGLSRPLDRMIASWPDGPAPEEYAGVRRRWDRLLARRTGLHLLALCCYVAGAIAS